MKKRNVLIKNYLMIMIGMWLSVTVNAQWTQLGNSMVGEAADDLSGLSVSTNATGDIVAIGAIFNSDNGSHAGQVRVYKYMSGSWTMIGSDINGEAAGDLSGYSVSLNAAGNIVAIGAPENDDSGLDAGQVRIYENIGGTWTQIGADLNGEAASDKFGHSVALNAAGNIVVIGGPENDDAGADAGHARVFENIGGTWTPVGSDIDGESAGDNSGFSVSINDDGNIIAVGAPSNGSDKGHVRVYENTGGSWIQKGSDIDGQTLGEFSGWSIDLNGSGNILAIGAPFNSDAGNFAGYARIFEYSGGSWSKVGSDINGVAANDRFGISVSINTAGNIVSVGAYKNDASGINAGQTRVFKNTAGTWSQFYGDINGETAQVRSGWSVSMNSSGSRVAIASPYSNSSAGKVRVFSICKFVVFLKDSYGNPLSGGMVEYQDGGWHTASELSPGVFCVKTSKSNIKIRTTYAQATLIETVPTNADHTIQTILTTFELRKRTGDLGYNFGVVSYVEVGTPLGQTGANGLGLLKKELLPRQFTFRMKFRGGYGDITQDITVNPVVTWEMARMLVQLNKSDGTRGLNGADIKYKGSSLESFGVTGTSENGRARKDLLPGFYKFTIKYLGGSMVVDNFQVVQGDNELIIDGVATTVELLDSDNANAPLDGGKARNAGYTTNLMGYTGDSGPGIVTVDLLPIVYSFYMTYDGEKDTIAGVDVTATPWVTFYTADLKSAELNTEKDLALAAYPNPFAGNTTIAFTLENDQDVDIAIYDINGRLIEVLQEGVMEAGNHKLDWKANELQNGIYIVRLSSNGKVVHKNLVKM